MTERLEYLEGKLGDSADKHSKAASGCAVLNVATILWSLMLPMSAPVALTVLTCLLPCCSLPSHELSNTEAKMRELSGPQDMTRRLDRRTLRCWIMILLRRHSLSGIFQYLVDSLPFHCPIHPWSQQDHPIYADILVSKAWQVTRWKEQPGRSQWGKSSKLVDVVLFFLSTFHLRSFIIGKNMSMEMCSRLKSWDEVLHDVQDWSPIKTIDVLRFEAVQLFRHWPRGMRGFCLLHASRSVPEKLPTTWHILKTIPCQFRDGITWISWAQPTDWWRVASINSLSWWRVLQDFGDFQSRFIHIEHHFHSPPEGVWPAGQPFVNL